MVRRCRKLDQVKVVGSNKVRALPAVLQLRFAAQEHAQNAGQGRVAPVLSLCPLQVMELWTCDEPRLSLVVCTAQRAYARRVSYSPAVTVCSRWLYHCQTKEHKRFIRNFRSGVQLYIGEPSGTRANWPLAIQKLRTARAILPNDGYVYHTLVNSPALSPLHTATVRLRVFNDSVQGGGAPLTYADMCLHWCTGRPSTSSISWRKNP